MGKKIIAVIVVVALLVGAGWWYKSRQAKLAAAQNQVRYIQTAVKRGDINASISGSGPIAAVNGVTVKSNQQGTVTQIMVQDGDQVKAGQVIMVLKNDNLTAALKQSQIDLQNSQQSLNNLLSPQDTAIQAQRLKVQNSMLNLQQQQTNVANLSVNAPVDGVVASVNTTQGSDVNNNGLLFTIYNDSAPTFVVNLPQQAAESVTAGMSATVNIAGFGSIQGTVTQSGAAATTAQSGRDSNVPVYVKLPATPGLRPGIAGQATIQVPTLTYVVQGFGSVKNDVTSVQAQVAATVGQIAVKEGDRVKAGDLMATLSSDNVTLALKQAQNDLATQQQALTNMIDPSQDPSGQLQTLKNKVQVALNNLAADQSAVDDLQVKAPVDGVISSLTEKVGDRVATGAPLFHVANYNDLQITITVDELDIAKVKQGQKSEIALDALPGQKFTGKVLKINPEGTVKNDIASFDVTVLVDQPHPGLMAGMNTSVSVLVTNKPNVLWLPAQAVKLSQGQANVQVLENDKPVTKTVQIGLRTADQVEITGGLKEGDQVILTTIVPRTTTTTNNSNNGGARFPGMGGGGFGGGGGGYTGGGGTTRSGGSSGGARAGGGGN